MYLKNIAVYIALILSFIFLACEKNYEGVINSSDEQGFTVSAVSSFNEFKYTPVDTTITLLVTFNKMNLVDRVFANIIMPSGEKISNIELYNNGNIEVNGDLVRGDNTFSNKFTLDTNFISGNYNIEYFVQSSSTIQKVAVHKFNFNNGSENIAPVISNLIVEPDTLLVVDTSLIKMTMKVEDSNGADDIEKVYFIVTKPDGTSNNFQVAMNDNGQTGDDIAGDGIYSLVISVFSTNEKGAYTFDFFAQDRGKKVSKLTHLILIQ